MYQQDAKPMAEQCVDEKYGIVVCEIEHIECPTNE
jgi:hypothetical protein